MMRRLVPLIVMLLSLACGNAPTSPSSSLQPPTGPPLPPGVPTGPPLTMRGEVWDTTNLPISGAQVQVIAPSGGPVAVTDGNGQFSMPWPFSGTVTVRVSKEGFHARERSVPEPGAPRYPVHLGFELEAIDAPIIVAGTYDVTFTAANECTQLPAVARQRTYWAHVYPNGRRRFSVELVGGDFPYGSVITAEVREEPTRTLAIDIMTEPDWVNPGISLVERVGSDMLLELTGSADLPLGAQSATAALDGTFATCAAQSAPADGPYRCPASPTTCRSANHRFAWTRR